MESFRYSSLSRQLLVGPASERVYSAGTNLTLDDCQNWLGAEPARESHYLTPVNIREMHRLLESCTKSCHPWELSSFIPTRLIDVGKDLSTVPRLVLSSDIPRCEDAKYAALSYCWGTAEDAKAQFKTERESLGQRCKGLPYEMMTSAIKDAVALTRAIGLRYVWVDALCIIQDDTDDWLRESSQMNLVYRHAFVTFCGLNSDSCHETLLQRAPTIRVSFQSTIRQNINGYYLIRLRPSSGAWLDRTELDYVCKWRGRAWTFQEVEMSTRLLLFGSSKMHFECGASIWSEGEDNTTTRPNRKILDQITKINQGDIPASTLYDSWLHMVHSYCGRLLTLEKDRLPAISGLARIIWETLGDQYLAGVWQGDLLRGLCWLSGSTSASRGFQNYLQTIQKRDYIAPSWSWASNTNSSSISVHTGHQHVPESTVVNVDVKTESQNPFGQVFGGFLQICGKLARIPASLLPLGDREEWVDVWWQEISGDDLDESIYVSLDWLSKGEESGLADLVMLLLLQYVDEEEEVEPTLYALLLYPANDLEYYRVGLMNSNGWKGYRLMKTWFKGSRNETICII
jgi:hypothetical protein